MRYLYVLVSGPNDAYYEQFLMSVTSLKFVMPDAEVVLLCDSKTRANLVGKRSGYEGLVSSTVTVNVPTDIAQIEVSRWIKTSMRRHVDGDFLFIDCDTVITEDLSEIGQTGIKLGACLDKHSLISGHGKGDGIIKKDKRLGFTSYLSNRHFNSGVIFCADTPETRMAFDRWHELWRFSNSRNTVRDQPAFNMAIYEKSCPFTELDGTWNCQISFSGLSFLANSKIIHYFASDLVLQESPFLLASNAGFGKIRETGAIPDDVMESLKNPRAAFVRETRIVAGEDMFHVLNSNFFKSLVLLRRKLPGLFNFINRLASVCEKTVKYFLIKTSKKKNGGIRYYN